MKTFVVAEIGANCRGSKERAMKLIKAAADSGSDAIKLQTFKPEDFVAPGTHTIPDGLWKGLDLHDLYKRAYLPWEFQAELFAYAQSLGLEAFSTPFSLEAVGFLESIECPRYKIASLEIGYLPLLEAVGKTRKPVMISTGAAEGRKDILTAVNTVYHTYPETELHLADVTLLKCVSDYPTPIEDTNLATLEYMAEDFSGRIGLSDHSTSTLIPALAVTAGATVIEKHLDLDDKAGLDGKFSLSPGEFYDMVQNIRTAEKAMGTATYETSESARKYRRRQDSDGNWRRVISEKPTAAEEIAMQAVESSNIKSAGYNLGQNILRIEFNGGGVYNYYEVPKDVFEGLVSAESVGKFFHKHIKGRYDYKKASAKK